MAFDISKALGDIGRRPAGDEEGRRELRYVPLHLIDRNPKNFYSTDGIDDLADNIRTFGLMEPLIVRQNASGRYTLISGHRRRLALKKIAEEAENYPESMHEPVACLVEPEVQLPGVKTGGADEILARQLAEELKLIYANADTRVMSSADTAQQVRRIRELFNGLRDLGYQFPGKMRDHVAAAAKVSATRVARLDVIAKGLTEPTLRKAWEDGTLGETAAYEIARHAPEIQKLALQRVGIGPLRGMTTEQVGTCLDACEADGNRDREACEEWNRNVSAMAEAAGNSSTFDGEAYLKERRKEDLNYRRAAKKAADSFFYHLSKAPAMTGFRNEDIEEIKTEFRHAGHSISAFSWTGMPKGMEIGSNDLHVGAKLRTWPEFYDVLAAIAINRCVEQAVEAKKKPAKVSAADTDAPSWKTGFPAKPGGYVVMYGVTREENQNTRSMGFMNWNGSAWVSLRTGAPIRDGMTVYRWFKLPEV